ncbi:metallophosphoesterase family protein [Virgibacillus oceani]|uniref:Metallophosphoesterase YhaO n=1 Tax=Virgibacillus oceani TaxID=1479511 RepID=A0A917HDB2_9BACI|nr:DNA repair exonuclease [Virgibacillus oceani]GGG74865.1 putative metallophosphoesterase YhaO [Virgibacillus oceani]
MQDKVSFIHAADLHLDSPFKGLARIPEHIFKEVQESTFAALERLVETAIQKQVDFVLLAGDLFDNERQSLKAQIRLRKAFEKLNEYNIAVYLSYGNHDYIKGNIHPIDYPENVFIFHEETIKHYTYKRDGRNLASIYGFSYETRAILTNKAKEFKIADETIPFHIAMLHGSIASNTKHDVYAPFKLTDLTQQHFDYWALGHIHQREIVSENPPVVYPGNTQGRHRKESGEKGCYHVTLEGNTANLTFIPLQAITFHSLAVNISACDYPHQLERLIERAVHEHQEINSSHLLSIKLTTANQEHKRWVTEGMLDDIIDLINESAVRQTKWYYIFQIKAEHRQSVSDRELYKGDHFIGELLRYTEEVSIHPFITDLYHHKQARKYMKATSNDEEQSIKNEAQQLLIHELLEIEGE